VLLEAQERKCAFLREHAPPNAASSGARGGAGARLGRLRRGEGARAAAVAAEWCLPLVRPAAPWCCGSGRAPTRPRATVAQRLAAEPEDAPDGFFVLRKLGRTPEGFPRRPGIARKRPLA
jgi:hypothetical protein